MTNRPSIRSSAIVLLLSLAAPQPRAHAQLFTPLGPIVPGGTSTAKALSRDGSTVVGFGYVYNTSGDGFPQPFRWTRTGGMLRLPSGQVASASGVSSDGLVVTGTTGGQSGYRPAFRWTPATGTEIIGTLIGGTSAYLAACNTDGSMITGVNYAPDAPNGRAVLWTPASGMSPLAIPAGNTFSDAPGISPDGSMMVGSSGSYAVVPPNPPTSHAVRWNSPGQIEDLGVLPGATHSSATALSDAGDVVVGYSGNYYDPNGSASIRSFRWLQGQGMQPLHVPGVSSRAYAVSADGFVIGGSATFRTGPGAFLWTPNLGLINLNGYLPMLGADLGVLRLQSTVGISADGRTIAGTAQRTDTFTDEAWIATLPVPLPQCLSLGVIQFTPDCPRERLTLSITTPIGTPYAYNWQVLTSHQGQWADIAGTVPVDCDPISGTGGTGASVLVATPHDPASPSTSVLLRPCPGYTFYTFRVLVYSDCASKESETATYAVCAADFNCDNAVSIADIFAYLNAWFNGDDAADFDGSGPATNSSLMAFIAAWFAGC